MLVQNALGAQADVAADRSGEQEWILQNDAEAGAQFGEIHFFDIDAVDADGAFLDVVEAQQQRDERGFAGAGVAHNGDRFARFDREGYVAQDPVGGGVKDGFIAIPRQSARRDLLGWTAEGGRPHMSGICHICIPTGRIRFRRHIAIGEPDVVELDAAAAFRFLRCRRGNDVHRSVQQFENAFACRHGGLQNVVFLAEVHDGAEEALGVLRKGDQHAE